MSPRDNEFDLPTVTKPRLPTSKGGAILRTEHGGVVLTEAQVTEVIRTGARAAGDLAEIAKGAVEIAKIRAEAKARVDEIDARTNQVIAILQKHIEAMVQDHKHLQTRGEIALDLVGRVSTLLSENPSLDPVTRQRAIDMVVQLADRAFESQPREKGAQHEEP